MPDISEKPETSPRKSQHMNFRKEKKQTCNLQFILP